jgi:WD40 repeat protein
LTISTLTRLHDFANGTASDAEAVDLDFNLVYAKVNELIAALASATEGVSLADLMQTPSVVGVAEGTLMDKLRDLKVQLDNVSLGQLPDASVTLVKLATSIQNAITVMLKVGANALALQGEDAVPNTNRFYDLFDDTNVYSCGVIDTTKSRATVAVAESATSITIEDDTGFAANKEYTIQQSDTKESFIPSAVTDNVLTVPALTNAFGVGAKVYRSNVLFDQGKMIAGTVRSTTFPTKIDDPDTLPSGTCNGVAYSPGGRYMALASSLTPFLVLYKRVGDAYERLPNPSSIPGAACYCVAFSPDGTYLTVGHTSTYGHITYKITIATDTFTALTHPTAYPSGDVYGASYSPDSTYLALAHSYTPYVTIYKIENDVFSKLANPATLPPGTGNAIAFSPDGTYLAIACTTTPFMAIYKRDVDSFNKLTNPTTIPTGIGKGVSWSKDSLYVAYAHTTTPFVSIYKRTVDSFAKLTNPDVLPAGNGTGACFSEDGVYLAIAHTTTPFVTLYEQLADVFTKIADSTSLPAGNCLGVAFGFDDLYLTVVGSTTPYVTPYKTGTQVTSVDARYDITPSADTAEVDAWAYRDVETNFSLDAYLSIVGASTDESFTIMDKTSTTITTDIVEEKFVGTVETAGSVVTLKLTINKDAASTKAVTKLLGAVL